MIRAFLADADMNKVGARARKNLGGAAEAEGEKEAFRG